MAAELQKRREADSAEPVAYIFKHPAGKLFWALTDESNKEQADVIPVYAAAPASVVPDNASESLAYAYKELTPEIMRNHLAVFERYGIAPNDSSTTIQALRIALDGIERSDAMLHSAEPVSNHEELPLDYLQGQKDGLEWAAQLAEANHPQTGDWLYDDPVELAKAIRKGPDMPEAAGNSPVTPDGWISRFEEMPDPSSEKRVCAFTPTNHEDMRYRFVPASLFKTVCRDATHWFYMLPPVGREEVAGG
ncbi:DUF551 domain-containing protein [Escherichia coli]|nr:DUF551 domain-containing protein [Escherichia coli]MCK3220248.1 DUF551 domain-containing protein [Escherichia coli]MEC4130140.1 DUF551 domain-containing protein [Escherichia coli]